MLLAHISAVPSVHVPVIMISKFTRHIRWPVRPKVETQSLLGFKVAGDTTENVMACATEMRRRKWATGYGH